MIFHYCNYLPDTFGVEIIEDASSNYGYDFDGSLVKFICFILNEDYLSLLGVPTFESSTNDFSKIYDKKESEIAFNISSGKTSWDDVYHDDRQYLLIKDCISRINLNQLKGFVDKVIIDDAKGTNASERLTAYEFVRRFDSAETNKWFDVCNFTAKCNYEIDPSEIDDNVHNSWVKTAQAYNSIIAYNIIKDNIQHSNMKIDAGFNYTTYDFIDLIRILLLQVIKENSPIRLCPNCGKYFAPIKKNAIYCNNPSPNDSSKTCSDYVKYQKYLCKTRNDEPTKLYKQIYNSKANKVRRCKSSALKEDLENFMNDANSWKSMIKVGSKTTEQYMIWLKEHKENSN